MLLLFELEITVLNCNQFSPLVILMTILSLVMIHLLYQSSTPFSGLPHVTDPKPHDRMHVILFYLHLHLFVV